MSVDSNITCKNIKYSPLNINKKPVNQTKLCYLLLFTVVVLNGCVGIRYLEDDGKILFRQKLTGAKGLDKEEIQSLYANKPNRRVLFLPWSPYIGLYENGKKRFEPEKYERKKEKVKKKYEKKINKAKGHIQRQKKYLAKLGRKIDKQNRHIKEGNLGMRLGEPLAVLDSSLEQKTIDQIKAYLNSKGYFNSRVSYKVKGEFELATVNYIIEKNVPYTIDSLYYRIPDEGILTVIHNDSANSLLQYGNIYEQQTITRERGRIHDLLLNSGYYDFSRQYISFEVDSSSLGDNRMAIGVVVKNPPGKGEHKVYSIDSVIFTTDTDIRGVSQHRERVTFNRVDYRFYEKRYSKKLLDWRLFIYPDSLYKKSNTLETQRQLSNLDIFKFINVNYDTTGGQFIANIFTSPLKKYQTSNEVGVNVSEGLPGPFVNFSLKNRNVFKGMEVMELNGRIGAEGLQRATENTEPYSSLEYGANLSFTFPQFLFPLGQKFKARIGEFNPQTKVTAGLIFTDRQDYLRNNINTSISYTWQNKRDRIYNFTLADVSYIDSKLTNNFDSLLRVFQQNGNNLINSFEPSFVGTSTFSTIYNINDYGNRKEKSAYIRYYIEAGGHVFNQIGSVFLDETESTTGSKIQLFQFIKLGAGYRALRPLNSRISLAYRFRMGFALPYGENETLPYEKFFFAGGSNSIRAWAPRRLGPGSYTPLDDNGNYSDDFEQQGEILFESSIEFRHKIFGFFYGAFFLDAGNTWTLRFDPSRVGSQFEFDDFYKEIAVGGGYGLRFDFSFLLLRFDAGIKLYDPAGTEGTKFIWEDGFSDPSYDQYRRVVWNIGIGYPF